MSIIHFKAKVITIGSWTLVRLPQRASLKLPSRGMAMVDGTINGFHIQTVLEPDGKGSHWFRVGAIVLKAARANAGDMVTLAVEPTKVWPEPEIPADLMIALTDNPRVYKQWMDITPLARWEWIRWIRATRQSVTRKRRIEITCSKLNMGERRPCCFNRNLCTETDVSKNGVLLNSPEE